MSNWEIEREVKFIKRDKIATEVSKQKFISEIKNGLGDEIKKKVTPKVKKENWLKRLIKKLLNEL